MHQKSANPVSIRQTKMPSCCPDWGVLLLGNADSHHVTRRSPSLATLRSRSVTALSCVPRSCRTVWMWRDDNPDSSFSLMYSMAAACALTVVSSLSNCAMKLALGTMGAPSSACRVSAHSRMANGRETPNFAAMDSASRRTLMSRGVISDARAPLSSEMWICWA